MTASTNKEPARCWQCRKVLPAEHPQPFFCNQLCGFEWALGQAYMFQRLKDRRQGHSVTHNHKVMMRSSSIKTNKL